MYKNLVLSKEPLLVQSALQKTSQKPEEFNLDKFELNINKSLKVLGDNTF